ncbi:hypothetical protein GUITHDRAFT_165451 [Guillardia theta CCMP2712]|uniref:Uncharacterized protein n=2 Tax=Guillardia theta TaxID=55529 RepID=L1ING1_GUITC|nr:hypothetical protein GUITHDRAFT_165451 [Guillardia theta CCMP2712]EKX37632.1 hypothetical protein GUITHDRAFT_165451 [Guillardia theta CCMP2712]|mmetsp:Transcript_2638/g.8831  ORF Transcript_2638/g.8831 Transcript_2638/m.8831 type:complete len:212 (+) Transcript_2638:90-725(+)|eukprot:XP_005824612.1 hypothetical protein GUITHDRAFT_165451 [Guillardia theta CCMP2712]
MCDCLSGDSVPGDPRALYANEWNTGMCNAPCANPLCCLAGLLCPCPSACFIRRQALDTDMTRYKCCQGYYDFCCFQAGNFGESSCPDLCNGLEALLCFSCSISSTRMLVMDTRDIRPDPCDNRLIGLNNCLQLLSCICNILAMFIEELEALADLVDFIADVVFALVSSCMIAQVNYELNHGARPVNWNKPLMPRAGSKAHREMRNQAGGGV